MVLSPVVPMTTRAQLLEARADGANFVRQSHSPGANRALPWLDTHADLTWRARAWRAALESGGVTRTDRILHPASVAR